MKPLIKIALVAMTILVVSAQAQTQTGAKTVGLDMQKLFNSYWKTAQATNKLQVQVLDIERERGAIQQQFKKVEEEFKKLQESANDQTISAEQREKRKKSAEEKLAEMRQIDSAFQQFNQNAQANLQETQGRMVRNIVKELREEIAGLSKRAGYGLVLNLNGDSVLYSAGIEDVTEAFLKDINSKAPPGAFDFKPLDTPKPAVDTEKKEQKK